MFLHYSRVSSDTKYKVITAEELMESNLALLAGYKEVPAGSVKVGTTTSWYVNGQEVRDRIHTTGALSGYQVLGTNMDTGSSYGKTDVQRNSS
ncbi:hypothetical protein, partial [Ornithinibacillus contaminans]|uniref:hypothetical protein n=1 Tax=Ornithinibacillus contaminans TaxID=694055 RepID=UPI00138F5446